MNELKDIWVYLSASPLLHLTLTLAAFVSASALYRRLNMNPLVNPVLLSVIAIVIILHFTNTSYCLLYTSPSPRDRQKSRMPSSA